MRDPHCWIRHLCAVSRPSSSACNASRQTFMPFTAVSLFGTVHLVKVSAGRSSESWMSPRTSMCVEGPAGRSRFPKHLAKASCPFVLSPFGASLDVVERRKDSRVVEWWAAHFLQSAGPLLLLWSSRAVLSQQLLTVLELRESAVIAVR